MVRILLAFLTVAVAAPVQACALLSAPVVSECCHKTKGCPKPVKARPCLECVGEVRSAAVASDHTTGAVLPRLPNVPVAFAIVTRSVRGSDPLLDHSSTYLRIGVLRL